VTSMDETTQQNAALVEEAAAAAESLVDQANQLTAAISQFKLDGRVGGGFASQQATSGGKAYKSSQVASKSHIRSLPKQGATVQTHANKANATPNTRARTGTDDSDWEEF